MQITKTQNTYTIDGKIYVRVTRVNEVINREGLNRWRENVGTELADERSEETSAIGSECHRFISKLIGGYSIPQSEWATLSPEIQNGICAYEQSRLTLKFKPIESEIVVYSELGFAGTTDALVKWKGKHWLFDWKVQMWQGKPWEEIHYQLAAYYHAYRELYNTPLEGCAALRFDRDTGVFNPKKDMFILQGEQLDHAYIAFLGAFNIYKYRRGYVKE